MKMLARHDMARPGIGRPSQVSQDREDSFDSVAPEDSLDPSVRGHRLPKDLSTCVFWCAVGMGALVKGKPIETVRTLHDMSFPLLTGETAVSRSRCHNGSSSFLLIPLYVTPNYSIAQLL